MHKILNVLVNKNKSFFVQILFLIYSDDDEVTTFFPIHKKPKKSRLRKQQKHKDVDTFSIQEMTIIESDSDGNYGDKSSDDDDCDSQLNLELPSRTNESILLKLRQMFCCTQSAQNLF